MWTWCQEGLWPPAGVCMSPPQFWLGGSDPVTVGFPHSSLEWVFLNHSSYTLFSVPWDSPRPQLQKRELRGVSRGPFSPVASVDPSFGPVFGNCHPSWWPGSPFMTMPGLNYLLACFQIPGKVNLLLSSQEVSALVGCFPSDLSWAAAVGVLQALPPIAPALLPWDLDAVPLSWASGGFQGMPLTFSGQFVGLRELVPLSAWWDLLWDFSFNIPLRTIHSFSVEVFIGSHYVPQIGQEWLRRIILFLFWCSNANLEKRFSQW